MLNSLTCRYRSRYLQISKYIQVLFINFPSLVAQNESDAMDNNGNLKTSTASITLKSATLPRRKAGKSEVQLSIKPPPIIEQPAMHFTTEMQHPISDFRSAPVRESPTVYSPIKTRFTGRASSLEPKEHIIPIQKPPTLYTRTKSNTTK